LPITHRSACHGHRRMRAKNSKQTVTHLVIVRVLMHALPICQHHRGHRTPAAATSASPGPNTLPTQLVCHGSPLQHLLNLFAYKEASHARLLSTLVERLEQACGHPSHRLAARDTWRQLCQCEVRSWRECLVTKSCTSTESAHLPLLKWIWWVDGVVLEQYRR
jgi:hypothetical protein